MLCRIESSKKSAVTIQDCNVLLESVGGQENAKQKDSPAHYQNRWRLCEKSPHGTAKGHAAGASARSKRENHRAAT